MFTLSLFLLVSKYKMELPNRKIYTQEIVSVMNLNLTKDVIDNVDLYYDLILITLVGVSHLVDLNWLWAIRREILSQPGATFNALASLGEIRRKQRPPRFICTKPNLTFFSLLTPLAFLLLLFTCEPFTVYNHTRSSKTEIA